MRCSAYWCINNTSGYCNIPDYVEIDEEGKCTECESSYSYSTNLCPPN